MHTSYDLERDRILAWLNHAIRNLLDSSLAFLLNKYNKKNKGNIVIKLDYQLNQAFPCLKTKTSLTWNNFTSLSNHKESVGNPTLHRK